MARDRARSAREPLNDDARPTGESADTESGPVELEAREAAPRPETPARAAGVLSRRLAAIVFYLAAIAMASATIVSAERASVAYEALSRYETPGEKTDTLVRDWASKLSFGLYEGGEEKLRSVELLALGAELEARRARHLSFALLGLSALFLALVVIGDWRSKPPARLLMHLLGVAGVFLVVGLGAPILTVSAHGEVALLGEVVLQHETKGILSSIAALAGTGNYVVAVLLGLFSVVVPVAKLVMSLVVLSVPHRGLRRHTLRVIDVIGKWSMADVFVVAVLLSFLAAETEQLTDATLGPGLYFFAGYGVLSMIAGHLMVRHEQALVADDSDARAAEAP